MALRAWHLTHTEVAARDSIGFIRYAWQLAHHPWVETIRDPRQQQHFGYPFAILAVSYPVRAFVPGPETAVMQLSAQLTSCLASILLVVPTLLPRPGAVRPRRRLLGRAAVPVPARPAAASSPTGLSEGVFLLLAATALFGAVAPSAPTRRPGSP